MFNGFIYLETLLISILKGYIVLTFSKLPLIITFADHSKNIQLKFNFDEFLTVIIAMLGE